MTDRAEIKSSSPEMAHPETLPSIQTGEIIPTNEAPSTPEEQSRHDSKFTPEPVSEPAFLKRVDTQLTPTPDDNLTLSQPTLPLPQNIFQFNLHDFVNALKGKINASTCRATVMQRIQQIKDKYPHQTLPQQS